MRGIHSTLCITSSEWLLSTVASIIFCPFPLTVLADIIAEDDL